MLSKFNIVEIEEIEKLENPSGIAYDLEVEEDHSYNVEGIIVHNSICSTRLKTGHGMPTLQSVMDCAKVKGNSTMIADGGIRNSGDIVKAMAAGADMVMLGSLLAGTSETPGTEIVHDGQRHKVYRGMASQEAQVDWRGHSSSLEGVSSLVPIKGPVGNILDDLSRGIRSGLSYSGCRSIKELQERAIFIRQSGSGAVESSTHISRVGEVR